ncbi:hypothetical protein MUG91_G140n24 [Manis pentadactyla]|nr:hypothetical protein MUG91_G140n24 [Manis pentadactyla]
MKRKAFALAWELRAERVRGRERPQSPWQPGTPRDPGRLRQSGGGCMRLEDSVVATAGPAPETGCGGEQPRPPAGQGCGARGEPGGGGPQDSRQQRKKFLYCEPHKRIKEVLEEELYIKRDECHIKNPPTVALEGIWSIKRNLPVGGLKPGLPSRNSLLPQAKYYSRHGGLRR